jgi:XTP/dITP diphosphohydrolase
VTGEPVARLLLATRNASKLTELRRVLAAAAPAGIDVIGLDDVPEFPEVPETGLTYEENALIKAVSAAEATGLPAVADDSGIAVDALGGSPGVFSARWSGRHGADRTNLELLLAQVADVPDQHRSAAFGCAAALALPDGRTFVTHGRMPGRLIRAARGEGGFGYDPIFVADGQQRTNAELTAQEKDAISHRGQALRALADIIARELTPSTSS